MATINKTEMTSDEDMEILKHLCTIGGTVKWCSHYGKDKKINKPQLNRVGRPEGEAVTLYDDSRAQWKGERLFFPGKDSANGKSWTEPSQVPFRLHERMPLPLLSWDLHMAHHGCRPWLAILCWPQINPSFLEKYLTILSVGAAQMSIDGWMDK